VAKENKTPPENLNEMAAESVEQARRAMENYLNFFQKSMLASPWGETDLNRRIQSYAGENIATAFECAQKLTSAKDIQDVVRIQTEFMQARLKALSEQAKDLGETATKRQPKRSRDR
jgi:hypothetical protein